MEKKKEMCTKRNTGLVRVLYVISVILLLIFVFMLIGNIGYIRNYITSYGMSVSDMVMESVQYIVTNSLSYLVYAVLVFCAAKVISIVSCKGAAHDSAEVASNAADIEDIVTDDMSNDVGQSDDEPQLSQNDDVEDESIKNECTDDTQPVENTMAPDYCNDDEAENVKHGCVDVDESANIVHADAVEDYDQDSDVDNNDEYSDAPNVDIASSSEDNDAESVNTNDIIVEKYNHVGVPNAVEQSDDAQPLEHTKVSDYYNDYNDNNAKYESAKTEHTDMVEDADVGYDDSVDINNRDFDVAHDDNEGVVIEKADYIYVSNAVESSDEELQQPQPAQQTADQTPQQDDYRFEAEEVISRLGASRQKAHRKGIVEEATENQSE